MATDSGTNEKLAMRWYSVTPTRYLFCFLLLQVVLYCGQWIPWLRLSQHKGWSVIMAVVLTAFLLLTLLIWVLVAWLARFKLQFGLAHLMLIVPIVAIPFGWFALELSRARAQREVFVSVSNRGDDIRYHNYYPSGSRGDMLGRIERRIETALGKDFFADLQEIDVSSLDVVKNIRHLSRLEVLSIRNCKVSDDHLKDLEALPELKELSLAYTRISDSGLWYLKRSPQLKTLYLSHTNVTDASLEQIGRLSKLEALSLVATPVTDAGLVHLKGLKNLQLLRLSETQITDKGLADLAGLTHLETLSCGATQITDDGLKHLAAMKDLSKLDLKRTKVTDAGLEHLVSFEKLSFLQLEETSVTTDGVEKLRRSIPNRAGPQVLSVMYFPSGK